MFWLQRYAISSGTSTKVIGGKPKSYTPSIHPEGYAGCRYKNGIILYNMKEIRIANKLITLDSITMEKQSIY